MKSRIASGTLQNSPKNASACTEHDIEINSQRHGSLYSPREVEVYFSHPNKKSANSLALCVMGLMITVAVVIISQMRKQSQQSYLSGHTGISRPEINQKTFYNLSRYSEKADSVRIWSSDFHISPVADAKWILHQLGSSMIDKSLSGHCHLTNTCNKDLRVLTKENGIALSPCPNRLRKEFYDSYRTDKELSDVDAVLCTHAASMCELFMPFNKSLIVIASTRYEIGRHESNRWNEWNNNLVRIANNPLNTVAANNLYDQEYIKFFTPISYVELLPSLSGYISERYNPQRREILIGPSRGVNANLIRHLKLIQETYNVGLVDNTQKLNKLDFRQIRDLYPGYEYSDLARHPAVVLLPYQISFMSFFEFYRMGIPMFIPTPSLLVDWHLKYHILNEKSWSSVFGQNVSPASIISKHPNSTSKMKHDPNNELSREALLEWVQLADFYVYPNITTFKSFNDLVTLISEYRINDKLKQISDAMISYADALQSETMEKWRIILSKARTSTYEAKRSSRKLPASFSEALRFAYGATLSDGCVGEAFS